MKNSKIKADFTKYYQGVKTQETINLFDKISTYEDMYKKDIAFFSKDELLDVLRSFGTPSTSVLKKYVTIINAYIEFYKIANKKDDSFLNVCSTLTTEDYQQCVNRFALMRSYISPDTLNDILQHIANPCDKFLVLAFYEGLKGSNYEEITELELSDIDVNTLEFKLCTGRVLKVSKQLCDIARLSGIKHDYISGDTMLELHKCPLIFKPRDNKELNGDRILAKRRVYKRMQKIKQEVDYLELSIPRLINSGFITQIKIAASENGMDPMDFMTSKEPTAIDIKERYGFAKTPLFQLRDTFKEYLA